MTDRRKRLSLTQVLPRGREARHRSYSVTQFKPDAPRSARPRAHQKAAQPEQNQARLAAKHGPKQPCRMVAVNFAERFPCRSIQQIHQIRIMLLLEVVESLANQPVSGEFAVQCAQFVAASDAKQCVSDALRAAESRNNA